MDSPIQRRHSCSNTPTCFCFESLTRRYFLQGWFPTLVGYGLQGFGKFGFYEMFKDVYKAALGEKAA